MHFRAARFRACERRTVRTQRWWQCGRRSNASETRRTAWHRAQRHAHTLAAPSLEPQAGLLACGCARLPSVWSVALGPGPLPLVSHLVCRWRCPWGPAPWAVARWVPGSGEGVCGVLAACTLQLGRWSQNPLRDRAHSPRPRARRRDTSHNIPRSSIPAPWAKTQEQDYRAQPTNDQRAQRDQRHATRGGCREPGLSHSSTYNRRVKYRREPDDYKSPASRARSEAGGGEQTKRRRASCATRRITVHRNSKHETKIRYTSSSSESVVPSQLARGNRDPAHTITNALARPHLDLRWPLVDQVERLLRVASGCPRRESPVFWPFTVASIQGWVAHSVSKSRGPEKVPGFDSHKVPFAGD